MVKRKTNFPKVPTWRKKTRWIILINLSKKSTRTKVVLEEKGRAKSSLRIDFDSGDSASTVPDSGTVERRR